MILKTLIHISFIQFLLLHFFYIQEIFHPFYLFLYPIYFIETKEEKCENRLNYVNRLSFYF